MCLPVVSREKIKKEFYTNFHSKFKGARYTQVRVIIE